MTRPTKETIWRMNPTRKEELGNILVFPKVFANTAQNKANKISKKLPNN